MLTDSSATVVGSEGYDAFGASRGQSGLQLPFSFAGEQVDAESGLVYLRARYLDPGIGRFVSRDPIGFSGGDVNLYGYVFNDPVNATDPGGLFFAPANGGDGCGTGGGGAGLSRGNGNLSGGPPPNPHPATPVGKPGMRGTSNNRGFNSTGANPPQSINGRPYSGHAVDRMQERGITPTVVEDTIVNGRVAPAPDGFGNVRYWSPYANVSVYVNPRTGAVVSMHRGGGSIYPMLPSGMCP